MADPALHFVRRFRENSSRHDIIVINTYVNFYRPHQNHRLSLYLYDQVTINESKFSFKTAFLKVFRSNGSFAFQKKATICSATFNPPSIFPLPGDLTRFVVDVHSRSHSFHYTLVFAYDINLSLILNSTTYILPVRHFDLGFIEIDPRPYTMASLVLDEDPESNTDDTLDDSEPIDLNNLDLNQ